MLDWNTTYLNVTNFVVRYRKPLGFVAVVVVTMVVSSIVF